MHHLLSVIATLSLASAIPLPQYNFLTTPDISTPDISTPDILTPDISTGDPWGITSIDTGNANTYLPSSPILLAETSQQGTSVDNQGSKEVQPATPKTPKLDTAWDGKDRLPNSPDRSGMGDSPNPEPLGQSAEDYWSSRGFPRVYGLGHPATPERNGGSADIAPRPLQNNEAGSAGAATLLLNGIINNLPAGLKEGY